MGSECASRLLTALPTRPKGLKSRAPCVCPPGARCPPLSSRPRYPRTRRRGPAPGLRLGLERSRGRGGQPEGPARSAQGGPRRPLPCPGPGRPLRPPPPARPAPTRVRGTRCGRAGSAPGAPRGRAAARAAAAAATAPRLPGAAPARPPGALRPPCGAGQARGGRGRGCGRCESGRKRSAQPGGGRQEGRRAGQEIPHRLPDPGPAAAGQAAAPAPRARPHPPAVPPPLRAAPAPRRPRANLGRTWKGPAGGIPGRRAFRSLPRHPPEKRPVRAPDEARPRGGGRRVGARRGAKAPWPAAPRDRRSRPQAGLCPRGEALPRLAVRSAPSEPGAVKACRDGGARCLRPWVGWVWTRGLGEGAL